MQISGPDDHGSFDVGKVPPFWLAPSDSQGRVLNDLVHERAKELWAWAFRHVQKELHDGTRAAEILQEVAVDVSECLKTDSEVGRNLKGYLAVSFINRVRRYVLLEGRIEYEGLIHELEENHHPRAPDWIHASRPRIL